MGGEPLEIVRSGKEGEFEAHGLGSGLVFVQASHQDLESPGLWLLLDEVTTPEPLHLVLRKKREVTAQDVVYSFKRVFDPKVKSPQLTAVGEEGIVGLQELNK